MYKGGGGGLTQDLGKALIKAAIKVLLEALAEKQILKNSCPGTLTMYKSRRKSTFLKLNEV
jgi:hypothetical protein